MKLIKGGKPDKEPKGFACILDTRGLYDLDASSYHLWRPTTLHDDSRPLTLDDLWRTWRKWAGKPIVYEVKDGLE